MIHALPGMGANRMMFPKPWDRLPAFIAHDWVEYSGEKGLSEMAIAMCEAKGIQDGDTIVGTSLGGMIACEIAKVRQIAAIYLIGSAIRKEEINSLLALIHPLIKVAPINWIKMSAGKVPLDLARMFAEIDPAFVRAMGSAVFQWNGLGESNCQVFRIHGIHDLVIPAPKIMDLGLEGGHLISMSHAEECVQFIEAQELNRSKR